MSILVNKAEITAEAVGLEMQYHPAPSQEEAWQMAAQSLVIRELLLQQASSNGLCASPESVAVGEDEQLIDQLLENDVTVPEADEETCRRFYDNHPRSFIGEKSGERASFEQAHANIRDYLHTKAMRIAVSEYIKVLSYDAKIKGFALDNL